MKKLITILVAVLFTACAYAQTPQLMSYQCVIRNPSNVLVTNQYVGMRVSILKDSAGGALVYREIYNPNPKTNANGLATVLIGSGIPLTGTFDSIQWQNGSYFIKSETDPTGGATYTITNTSQLLSVPYAQFAKNGIIAYGNLTPTGTINFGSNNYTVDHPGTGTYNINWTGNVKTYYAKGLVNISTTFGSPRITSWSSTGGGTILQIYIYDISGNLVDDHFAFTVYQP